MLAFPELSERLTDLFGLAPASALERLPGGYKCDNFRLECGPDVLFLKTYKNRISHWIAQIKAAEQFFARQGLPVVEPIRDRFGRPMFMAGGSWHSIFPFIDSAQPQRGAIRDTTIASMGQWLGHLHRAGRTFDAGPFQRLHAWDREAFRMELIELRELVRRREHNALHNRILETLEKKSAVVESTDLTPGLLPLSYDCLLHGDFIYQNTFINTAGEVTHVFDLEKTCMGPRAYELARSLLINCFDTAWEEDDLRKGRLFLSAYRDVFPIGFDEFYHGMRMYMVGVAHSTWVEGRILLGIAEPQHHELYASHALRIEHVSDDPRDLCETLYGG